MSPHLDYFILSFIQQFSSEMSSRVLFESLKSLLTSMMCLGIFPWRFVQEDDKTSPVPHLKPLDWKIHMAIFLVNVTIWSLPFDVHFWYGLLFALHPNESQNSSNGLGQIRNESSLLPYPLSTCDYQQPTDFLWNSLDASLAYPPFTQSYL